MAWKRKKHPTIPGYESEGNTVRAKRWLDFKINQLLDTEDPVWEVKNELESRKEVVNTDIEGFKYPMKRGKPCDKHYNNWFKSMSCHTISADFWQMASETLRTLSLNLKKEGKKAKGVGDCEDTSALLVDLFLEKGWKGWECLGRVYRGDRLLGGHGWPIVQDENGDWRLVESTLDEPKKWPTGYPKADPKANDWKVGDLRYHASMKFNRSHFYKWKGESVGEYLKMDFDEKNRREKFEAIQEAFETPVSPIEQAGILSKLRRW